MPDRLHVAQLAVASVPVVHRLQDLADQVGAVAGGERRQQVGQVKDSGWGRLMVGPSCYSSSSSVEGTR